YGPGTGAWLQAVPRLGAMVSLPAGLWQPAAGTRQQKLEGIGAKVAMGGQAKAKKKSKPKRKQSRGAAEHTVMSPQERMKARMQDRAKKKTAEKYTVDQLLEKAEDCMDNFDFSMARMFCQRALDVEPTNLTILDMLGNILHGFVGVEQMKAFQSLTTTHAFLKAVELSPEAGHGKYMYLGQIHTGKEAVQYFSRGVEVMLSTMDAQAQGACGGGAAITAKDVSVAFCSIAEIFFTDLCMEDGAADKCKETLEKALQYDQHSPEALQLMASYLFSLDNTEPLISSEALQHLPGPRPSGSARAEAAVRGGAVAGSRRTNISQFNRQHSSGILNPITSLLQPGTSQHTTIPVWATGWQAGVRQAHRFGQLWGGSVPDAAAGREAVPSHGVRAALASVSSPLPLGPLVFSPPIPLKECGAGWPSPVEEGCDYLRRSVSSWLPSLQKEEVAAASAEEHDQEDEPAQETPELLCPNEFSTSYVVQDRASQCQTLQDGAGRYRMVQDSAGTAGQYRTVQKLQDDTGWCRNCRMVQELQDGAGQYRNCHTTNIPPYESRITTAKLLIEAEQFEASAEPSVMRGMKVSARLPGISLQEGGCSRHGGGININASLPTARRSCATGHGVVPATAEAQTEAALPPPPGLLIGRLAEGELLRDGGAEITAEGPRRKMTTRLKTFVLIGERKNRCPLMFKPLSVDQSSSSTLCHAGFALLVTAATFPLCQADHTLRHMDETTRALPLVMATEVLEGLLEEDDEVVQVSVVFVGLAVLSAVGQAWYRSRHRKLQKVSQNLPYQGKEGLSTPSSLGRQVCPRRPLWADRSVHAVLSVQTGLCTPSSLGRQICPSCPLWADRSVHAVLSGQTGLSTPSSLGRQVCPRCPLWADRSVHAVLSGQTGLSTLSSLGRQICPRCPLWADRLNSMFREHCPLAVASPGELAMVLETAIGISDDPWRTSGSEPFLSSEVAVSKHVKSLAFHSTRLMSTTLAYWLDTQGSVFTFCHYQMRGGETEEERKRRRGREEERQVERRRGREVERRRGREEERWRGGKTGGEEERKRGGEEERRKDRWRGREKERKRGGKTGGEEERRRGREVERQVERKREGEEERWRDRWRGGEEERRRGREVERQVERKREGEEERWKDRWRGREKERKRGGETGGEEERRRGREVERQVERRRGREGEEERWKDRWRDGEVERKSWRDREVEEGVGDTGREDRLYVKLCCEDPPLLEHTEQLLGELGGEETVAGEDDDGGVGGGPSLDDIADDFVQSSDDDEEEDAMEH
ncbi:hypothetical protein P4O66_005178, partial [Electrophorus voltai]